MKFSIKSFLKQNQFYYFTKTEKKNLDNVFYTYFDICFLSIGNDNLAGPLVIQVMMTFCVTDNAKKPPRKRLSYKVEKLFYQKKYS